MDGFSIASITATCRTLSHRALSATVELDEILQRSTIPIPWSQKLASLSAKLEQFKKSVEDLQQKLDANAVVSGGLKRMLSAALQECDGAAAVLSKQVKRIGPQTAPEAIDLSVISQYEYLLESFTKLFVFSRELLLLGNLDDQDQTLSDAGGRRAVEQATDASQVVKSSRGILLDLGDAEYQSAAYEGAVSSTLVGGSDTELPPSFEEATSASQGSQASSSKGGSGGGFMSSLQHSFKAMTAAMRPKPEPFVSPLCQAAARGDIQQIRGFLAEGANINGRNENGNTALISAVLMNRIEAAKFLLTAGADHTVKDSGRKCKPPFFHAIDVGATAIIELLLARGVDVNERNIYGQPYFVDAINTGDLDTIRLLLTRGANVNTTDISGSSILAIAIKKGNQRLVKLFLEFGADVNSRDLTGQPVVILAFSHGRNDIVTQLLSRGADPNSRSITGSPFVIEALNKNDTRLVEDLLARGANSNAQDIMGVKMLSLVVNNKVISEEDREKLVKILLSHGANPNETDSWGKPALLLAVVASSNTRMLKMFLEHGANPNAKSATDETFLINFIDQGNWERVKLLLQYGANPNEGDKLGRTPLILALQKGKTDVVQLLIQHGVDVNKMASISPLAFVHATGNARVEQLLRQHGANGPVDDIVVAQEPRTAPQRAESPSPPGYDAHDSTTRIL